MTTVYPLESTPPAEYIEHRIALYDRLKREYDEDVESKKREPIVVRLKDGKEFEAVSWQTTPLEIARGISKTLSENTVICKVDGELFDLSRPLEVSCEIEFLDFESSDEAKAVFWHSSAHVLGEACERHYSCHLCLGPPIEEGFYYEMDIPKPRSTVSQTDYPMLEKLAAKITSEKQRFERLMVKKDLLLEMFKHNPLKLRLIEEKIDCQATVYRCGPLIDLCRGPHVPHTGYIRGFAVTKSSASHLFGNQANMSLQRIYGLSFPTKKQLKERLEQLEQAQKRDHRRIGVQQELFFFNELSPGSCFFLPNGALIYNRLIEMQRVAYRKHGFFEVVTPNIFNTKLWETSGHWAKYQENMFSFQIEKDAFALKPMNCPGHCLMFAHRARSYNELPMRLADFGVLHRNEASGALSGLTRVRRFQQDDAHIFCTAEQVGSEISRCLDFLKETYAVFGFEFELCLSTRPDSFLGEIAVWDEAEKQLERALVDSGYPWTLNPKDGAFYGPKIDITIRDALRRAHQCATIQLDFQLPERFQLAYQSPAQGLQRPVMIHRAIFGSIERMMGILIEHYAGRWPFWLSPRQAIVIPVSKENNEYALTVKSVLHDAGYAVDADVSDFKLDKKIRNAEIALWNYLLVVGKEEQNTQSVNVRCRDDKSTKSKGVMTALDDFMKKTADLVRNKTGNGSI